MDDHVLHVIASQEIWHPLVYTLQRCARQVQERGDLSYVVRTCADVIRVQCEQRFLVYHYADVPVAWRALHTDAILLSGVATLAMQEPTEVEARIRDLDVALIVSGAPDREADVHMLLRALQAYMPTHDTVHPRLVPDHIPLTQTNAARTVDEYAEAPSLRAFLDRCPHPSCPYGAPFVVRGFARDWPAMSRWRDPSDLCRRAGPGRVVPVEKGLSYTDEAWGQGIVPWSDFLARIGWSSSACEPLYLAQHTLHTQFPWLAHDIILPDYVYACPPHPGYVAYHEGMDPIQSVWIGPRGTDSPAHTDPYYNCYVQVVGHKHVWLAPPPLTLPAMSPDAAFGSMLQNTTQLSVWEAAQSPAFVQEVVPHAQDTELHPGDMLFLPPMWWHAMKSTSQSFSVSFWF